MLDPFLGNGTGGRSAFAFLARLGVASVFVFLGSFPILAGLGLLRLERPIEPLAIPVALLFGGIFVALGLAFVWGPLVLLASARGADTWKERRALVWRLLRERVSSSSILAGADLGLLALASGLALVGWNLPLVGSDETLGQIIALEFLTIHAFPFLVVALTFWQGSEGMPKVVAAVMTVPILLGYGIGGWVFGGGPWGLFWLVYLWVPNLAPFLSGVGRSEARLLAVSRWCLKASLFMFTAGVVGDSDLSQPGGAALGLVYFSLVTVMELVRLAEVPRDLALAWKNL